MEEQMQQGFQDRPRSELPLAWACTDVGMVRESNQDSFHINTKSGLYLVADGMGGRAGGEVASGLATDVIASEIEKNLSRLESLDERSRLSFFAASVNKASLRIYERSLELPQYRGMGTTTTLLWIPPKNHMGSTNNGRQSGIIAHVGDSRCYLCRAGFLFQLTDDHSLVNEQVKAGVLSSRDPMIAQIRNVITRCVGYQEDEEVDTLTIELMAGDRFLLCSDGLSTKVTDEEIRLALLREDLSAVAQELTALANARGGDDNTTIVIVTL